MGLVYVGVGLFVNKYSIDKMEENIIEACEINLRNKGTKLYSGKIHKGCVKDAFTKLSIGSIPSNYESIIYHHEEKRGFGTSQKRFNSIQNHSELLKIDCQSRLIEKDTHEVPNVSESKKGFGPLIAKEKRQWLKLSHSPGPGKYFKEQLQKFKENKYKSKCKNKYLSEKQDLKRKQIQLHKESANLPGPGYYESNAQNKGQILGCKSSFISKYNRQAYIPKSITPGPGCYIANQENATPPHDKRREIQEEEYYRKLTKQKKPKTRMFVQRHSNVQVPGPGYYDADIPNFKPLYQRIKISNNFMQSAKDRFNDSPDKVREENEPNVCTYEIPSTFDKIEKKLIDMPCFMSQSKRQPFTGVNVGSKVFYDVSKDNKANFHFNISGDWIC